ncbi:hypothetical protein MCOR11_000458 [Pyricularia oryzae]|uniref:Clr5 domain-containing protein n=1 Tax=Pyricularia grisea TaxID=148305 RepID=A0ABQ8NIC3_PYRGI|nr:hypothetical protein MCOR33_006088 [Pyricularia grisea]KAI6503990.1 hypothetical protein MCOR11_000458 [Pyricularia oryzae]
MADPGHPGMDRSIPHDDRWPLLKEVIIDLYINKGMSIPKMANHMKDVYDFDAQQPHYRYRLKLWKVHKRIKAKEKEQMIVQHARRQNPSATTSDITVHKGGIHKKLSDAQKTQLRRYLKRKLESESLPNISPGFHQYPLDHQSPSASAASPLFTINSPADTAASPRGPIDAPSPTTCLVRQKTNLSHVGLFLQGRQDELMKSLNAPEQRDAAIWFHDLFMFSFMSVKYYGRGPTRWDAELIATRSLGGLPTDGASHQARALPDISNSAQAAIWDDSMHPTMLCRWSFHYEDDVECDDAVYAPSPPHAPQAQDIEDETTWMPWEGNQSSSLSEILQDGMTSGSFTKATTDLPITSPTVSAALERSKDQLEAEAFAIAIASGNHDYLSGLRRFDLECFSGKLGDLFPFHLAATHLRGATSCCLIADYLVENMDGERSVQRLNRNDLSHTILDSLMITILRSHTSVSPAIVCEALGKAARFPGEGIEVCGRWDLDSPCVRRLFASGRTSVPMSWKHPFCHTSVQAVCHFITALFSRPYSPDINLESGIFLRRCCCGDKLRPRPLHTLVMVAYCLASHGAPGETLFGAIAVLTCMLVHNANPLDEADLAIPLLFFPGGTPDTGNCQHTPMTPIALAHALQGLPHHQWTSEVRLGWDVFVMTMKLAAAQRSNDEGMSTSGSFTCEHYYDSDSYYDINNNTYCASPGLGRIWATIQAELVTYRRLGEEDAWISTNFDLRHLRQGLELGSDVSFMPFVSSSMIKDFSRCGWFVFGDEREDRADYRSITIRPMPRAQDVCSFYFMNMEDWSRSTFIPLTDFLILIKFKKMW